MVTMSNIFADPNYQHSGLAYRPTLTTAKAAAALA